MAKVFRPSNRESSILSRIESSKEHAKRTAINIVRDDPTRFANPIAMKLVEEHLVETTNKNALEEQILRNDPVPLITRVSLSGKTEAHPQLAGDLEYLKEALRSTAIAHFGDRVWIEKITVATQPPNREGRPPIDPGPILELERLVAEIQSDNDLLHALGGELTDLFRKLPAEYRQGTEALDPANPSQLHQFVNQAHALLTRGLKRETDEA